MGQSTHRRGGRPGVSMTLVVSVLFAFALGWLAAALLANPTASKAPAAPPPAATPASPSAIAPSTGASSTGPVVPVGFAQPAVTANSLQVMSVLTKVKGGVDVTLVAQNRGDQPVTVDTASLGPHDVTFRGAPCQWT